MGRGHAVSSALRVELIKLRGLMRVRVVLTLCLAMPFVVAAAVRVQDALPQDTLFGQWLHESGFALPMVVLGFCGQWVLPLLSALVAGDIFSSEDHFGTWKTVLTRSRSRGDIFLGKIIAAIAFILLALFAVASASVLAGLALGREPVVGLSGQLVPAGTAFGRVVASWAVAAPPELGFCALAILLSVVSRNSVIGIGAPVVLGLLMQLSSFVALPSGLRYALLSTGFSAWHGLWTQPGFLGPLWRAVIVSMIWFGLALVAAWLVFRHRSVRVA